MREKASIERIRELLNYDPDTGSFTWRINRGGGARAGDTAGSSGMKGYRQVFIDGKTYRAHKIAWVITHGVWPTGDIDHIDGVRDNNKIKNLRDVPSSMNRQNMRSPTSHNVNSRILGAHFCGRWNAAKPWRVSISINSRPKHIGYYATPEEAHEAYVVAKRIYHEGNTL